MMLIFLLVASFAKIGKIGERGKNKNGCKTHGGQKTNVLLPAVCLFGV